MIADDDPQGALGRVVVPARAHGIVIDKVHPDSGVFACGASIARKMTMIVITIKSSKRAETRIKN